MNLVRLLLAQFLPTRDVNILELRRIIKKLKEENNYLKKEVKNLNNDKGICIQFYDDEIEDIIIENLEKAEKEICIAMAWLTSENIMKILGGLKKRGVDIKIIVDNNDRNNKVRLWNPCDILKMAKVNRPGSRYNNYMHNKYCIIDNKKVIDGSYNWSKNAKYNLEHVIVIEDENTAEKYRDGFNKIFNNPRYYDNYTITENAV